MVVGIHDVPGCASIVTSREARGGVAVNRKQSLMRGIAGIDDQAGDCVRGHALVLRADVIESLAVIRGGPYAGLATDVKRLGCQRMKGHGVDRARFSPPWPRGGESTCGLHLS